MPLTRLDPWRALLAASALLWHRQAVADESDAARLFREGRALVVEGRFAEACPRLEESQRREPRLGTQLNVAFCHERLGKLATAWLGFREALLTARADGDGAREGFAKEQVEALEPRVPRLRVRGAAGASMDELTVLLDGAPLAPSTWGEELPVDPGEHVLVATHGGEEYWRTTVTLRESEHADVTLPAPTKAPAPTRAAGHTSRPTGQAPRFDTVPDAASARDAETRRAGRFIYELGAFIGFIYVESQQSTPNDGPDSIQAVVVNGNVSQRVTCASAACDYLPIDSAGLLAGAAGFVGYAAAPHVNLGLRFLLGPRAGGGALVALGPSASFLLDERFTLGPTVLFGTASHESQGLVVMEGLDGTNGPDDSRLRATLGFSMGVGAELGLKLGSSPTGAVVLQVTPLFLYGSNGTALSLPLGAAYHWN